MPRLFQYQSLFRPLSQDAGFVEEVTLDKWWRETGLPIFLPPPTIEGQVFAPVLALSQVSFGWHKEIQQPIFSAYKNSNSIMGGRVTFVPPAINETSSVKLILDLVNEDLR